MRASAEVKMLCKLFCLQKHRDKMLRSRLETHIKEHTSREQLESALEAVTCYNVPDLGERGRAREKLAQYWDVKTGKNG